MLAELDVAIARQDEPEIRSILRKVEDLVFYLARRLSVRFV